MTRWEVTIAQALSYAGYATGMWGKWHLGSDPGRRSSRGHPTPTARPNQESYAPRSTSRSARSPSTSRPLLRAMTSPQNHTMTSIMRAADEGDSRFLHEGSRLTT